MRQFAGKEQIRQKELSLCNNFDVLILKSFQPKVVDLQFFKL